MVDDSTSHIMRSGSLEEFGTSSDGKYGAMVLHELVPYFPSLVKMAIASFRMAFSSSRSLIRLFIGWVKMPLTREYIPITLPILPNPGAYGLGCDVDVLGNLYW
jgi:hypothetical protein